MLITFVLLCIAIFGSSCGVFNPPTYDGKYYDMHYDSCGPRAIVTALTEIQNRGDIVFKQPVTLIDISKQIQDNDGIISLRSFLTILDREASQITWPDEIHRICAQYGIETYTVKSVEEIKNTDKVAIILVHKKGTLRFYHWTVYSETSINFYGKGKTVVDQIIVLKSNWR